MLFQFRENLNFLQKSFITSTSGLTATFALKFFEVDLPKKDK